MYFWNIKKLKQELKDNTLSESSKFYYYLIIVSIISLWLSAGKDMGHTPITILIIMMIIAISLYFMYICNKGANGKDFVNRSLAISLVTLIRSFPVVVLVSIVIGFIAAYSEIPTENIESLATFITLAYYITYYILVINHIKDVANNK